MKFHSLVLSGIVATATVCASFPAVAEELTMPNQEPASDGRWFFSPGIGWVNFEGDQPLKDGLYLTLRMGYDLNQWWSVEGGVAYAPELKENTRYPWQLGRETSVSRSKGEAKDFGDTWMAQTFIDFLFHMTMWEKMDPYLAVGLGLDFYGEDCFEDKIAGVIRVGGGLFYHISDSWALRLDTRVHLESDNTEFNHFIDLGFRYTFGGAGLVDDPMGPQSIDDLDSDGDGLKDRYELEIGTDPMNPDTDGDGLTDGEEVLTYGTDPLNPDSDYDWLNDGYEVHKSHTNPLDPDTDKGGVMDGHEVLVDGTDPRSGHGDDDVMLVRLNVQFDTDKSIIKDSFDEDLQKVVKVLLRNPGATAVIEGHADQRSTVKAVKLVTANGLTRAVGQKMVASFARTELLSGTTTIRTVGGIADFDTTIRDEIRAGKRIGPRILAGNMAISVPEGHMAGSLGYLAHNAEEARHFVDVIAQDKPDLIKLMITGGVMDATVVGEPGVLRMQPELVKAACDRAHALGFQVAAHVESPAGVRVALENGVDSIEHGAKPDSDTMALFQKTGAFQVSTISPALPYALFDRAVSGATYEQQMNGRVVFDGIIDMARACLAAGVPVGLGTDTACPYITHYDMWREVYYFAKYCGVSNAFALHSATLQNARLARVGDITGSIEVGKCADMIVTPKNPLEDLTALRDVKLVASGGRIIRNPKVKKMEQVERELDKFL